MRHASPGQFLLIAVLAVVICVAWYLIGRRISVDQSDPPRRLLAAMSVSVAAMVVIVLQAHRIF